MNLEVGWDPLRRVLRTKDVRDEVHAEGTVHLEVTVLPLLEEATMRELLREELVAKGWEKQADGTLTRGFGTAVATLAADGRSVTLRETVGRTITGSASERITEDDERDKRRVAEVDEQLEERARTQLEQVRAREKEAVEREALRKLVEAEPELRAELQEALNRTYRRALETRARQLGDVESVREQGDARGDYEVTITVKA